MKKTDWGILGLTALYSFLFYQQTLGLNALLFGLFTILYFAWENPDRLKNRLWLVVAVCTLVSSLFVLVHSSNLSILAFYASLLLLSSFSIKPQSSVIINLFFSLYSVLGSLVFMGINFFARLTRKSEKQEKNLGIRLLAYLIPIAIAFIFFVIYKKANPLFEKYTQWINLDFISMEWIGFTFGGLIIVHGLVRHQRIAEVQTWEDGLSLDVSSETMASGRLNEKKTVTILFVLLNLMVLFINLLDVNYLYLGAGLPEGLTHKQFVHNGVGTLVLSIVLGISIILFFFRGALNFGNENKNLRLLVYFWLLQNLMMVISTALRNHIYIMDALLTYKRIGVYYWLFMAALGLVSTYHKIKYTKSAWFMIKTNALFAFVILVLSSVVDWDKLITDFNIARVPNVAGLDKRYLISISETNLAQLYQIKNSPQFNIDSSYHYHSSRKTKNTTALDEKLVVFLMNTHGRDWRSYSARKSRVKKELEDLNANGKITSLNLSKTYIEDPEPIKAISNIQKLELNAANNPNAVWLKTIKEFKKLDTLCLTNVKNSDVNYLIELKNLKTICLSYTDKEVIEKLKQELPNTVIVDRGNKND